MKLHLEKKLFADTIRSASDHFKIIPVYIEKDYWITLVLSKLAKSEHANEIVFKGGTSLSKGYNLIDRFSEDIDIAIISNTEYTGNQIKILIRDIEKEITQGLIEKDIVGVSSKGSRFRKSVFEYESIDKKITSNKLIVEINSFSNPYPFSKLSINSFVFDFLIQTGNEAYVQQYDLKPFNLNVLNKCQTLLEKLVSLIRFSYEKNVIPSIASKIRHFYDLYFLLSDDDCAAFIQTEDFINQFKIILNHDREAFDIPQDWAKKSIGDSPLITDFSGIWDQLKDTYTKELSVLAFSKIPAEKEVALQFEKIIKRLH